MNDEDNDYSLPRIPLLSEATTDQLWDELKRRYNAALFAHVRDTGDDLETFNFSFSGGRCNAIGLAKRVEHCLLTGLDLEDDTDL